MANWNDDVIMGDCFNATTWNAMSTCIKRKEADYIIYKDGGITYALNGNTGNIDSSNVDSATVIQFAIDALVSGGRITLKVGTYVLTVYILIDNAGILLEGCGKSTILDASGIPYVVDASYGISVTGNNVEIRNLTIHGDGIIAPASSPYFGIKINGDYCTIEGCKVYDFYSQGIDLAGDYNLAFNNRVYDNGDDAISSQGDYNNIIANKCSNANGDIGGLESCIELEAGASYNMVSNNICTGTIANAAGIEVHSHFGSPACKGNTINCNQCYNCAIGTVYGSSTGVHSEDTTITGNTIYGSTSDAIISLRLMDGITVIDNTIINSGNARMLDAYPNGGLAANIVTRLKLSGNTFRGINTAYIRFKGLIESIISDNIFISGEGGSSPYSVLWLYAEANDRFSNVEIKDNHFYMTRAGSRKSINLQNFNTYGTQGQLVISGNQLEGTGTVIMNYTQYPNLIMHHNTGWKTDNKGVTANVADGGTITHGLGAMPVGAKVTPSVAGELVSVTALGAANFTVAIKKHDGTPGTNQTIYWEAWI